MKNKEKISLAPISLATMGLFFISLGAFSRKVRREIFERDGGKSVISGETENLEAAHINHDKKSPDYNKAHNGRMLTTAEHLQIDHIDRAGRNGLPENHNNYAVDMLKKRLPPTNY